MKEVLELIKVQKKWLKQIKKEKQNIMNYQEECIKTKNMIKNHLLQFGGNATKMCLDKLFEK